MGKGKVRKMFPGGNTAYGFYSYYDHIIEPDATRIFVIKGGPGVGKSTFMRRIGEDLLNSGYDLEFMCCSSDNDSLDGLVVPSIRVALIDGTAPHVLDPKNPGVVDEIIHLGDFWDESKMRPYKQEVIEANRRVGRLFQIAYSQLKEAKVIKDEAESYVSESMDFAGVNQVLRETAAAVFKGAPVQHNRFPKIRRLFCSAISPDGVVHYLETLLQDTKRLYLIQGPPGSGRSTFLSRMVETATIRGLDLEVFHCAFDPREIDLVAVPALKTAILKDVLELHFSPPQGLEVCTVNLEPFSDPRVLASYAAEVAYARRRFSEALARAIQYIREAKLTHDYMEGYYIPAMDFAAVEEKRREILTRIKKYAAETGL
ncbi:MAG: PRK06851 family protein [Firmicutes bacterium]|nr:PRK06851 family protein [Bacillota bacterium]